MKMLIRLALCSLFLATSAVVAPPLHAEGQNDVTRLHLTDGGFFDARGPVTRGDGLIVFRTLDGELASIREASVSRMELIQAKPQPDTGDKPAAAKPAGPKTAPATTPAPASFSNTDLREPGDVKTGKAVFTNVDLPQAAEDSTGVEPAAEGQAAAEQPAASGDVYTNQDLPEGGRPPEDEADEEATDEQADPDEGSSDEPVENEEAADTSDGDE